MKKRLLTLFLLVFIYQALKATDEIEPLQYDNYFGTNTYINPAVQSPSGLHTSFRYSPFIGFTVRNLYTSFRLTNKRRSLGILFSSFKEGPFLGSNQVYFLYSRKIRLNKDTYLIVGSTTGLYNYVIQPTLGDPGVSAFALDGSLSIGIAKRNLEVYILTNQLYNTLLNVRNSMLNLRRVVGVHVKYSKEYRGILFQNNFIYRSRLEFQPRYENHFSIGYRKLVGGLGIQHPANGLLHIGIQNLVLNQQELSIVASISLPYQSDMLMMAFTQLSLDYTF